MNSKVVNVEWHQNELESLEFWEDDHNKNSNKARNGMGMIPHTQE